MYTKYYFLTIFLLFTLASQILAQETDAYLWLEEIEGESALSFVTELNNATTTKLSSLPYYEEIYNNSITILNSNERIAFPSQIGAHIYNFWQDESHVRGVWRRTTKEAYTQGNPEWEILINVDSLSNAENRPWVFKGARANYPEYNTFLVLLSDGGTDANYVREFNVQTKQFVEDGFFLPNSKSRVFYISTDTLIVSSAFDSAELTESGYARRVVLWKRGADFSESTTIFTGQKTDVLCVGYSMRDNTTQYIFIDRRISFFSSETFVWISDSLVKLPLPLDCRKIGIHNNQLLIRLGSDWNNNNKTYTQGSLISLNFKDLLSGIFTISPLFVPNTESSISEIVMTQNHVLVNTLVQVSNQLLLYTYSNNNWESTVFKTPDIGTISIVSAERESDSFYFSYTNFLTPTTLYYADAHNKTYTEVASLPSFFSDDAFSVTQHFATSKDGTQIPYFIVACKNIEYTGKNPTLLYAYGGFEISVRPSYSAIVGKAWLEKGGVYVVANIRGGGEFGPQWHQAGLRENRQRVFDDFYAVSEELIQKKITSPSHLGIMGGSNGGLLVGVAFTQRPDLYNAVVCLVPLLDMRRYNTLLAGASWVDEYGNPDNPDDWAFIKKYSPYHNLSKDANYPVVFFSTSTRDDRVHPGHARKMAANMIDLGHEVFYYENIEGGHAGSSTNEQRAKSIALQYSYLYLMLGIQ